MPRNEFSRALLRLEDLRDKHALPCPCVSHVTRAYRADLEAVYRSASAQRRLFPSGVLVRDSQSFGVAPHFTDFNVPLILADHLDAMFMTRDDVAGSEVASFSFGTPILSSVKRDILRLVVDYYGTASADVIRSHLVEHLLRLPVDLDRCPSAKVVCCVVFLPKSVCDAVDFKRDVEGFFAHESLGFDVKLDRSPEQCIALEVTQPDKENGKSSKL